MKQDFSSKHIIISGGSGGIGQVIAQAFLENKGTVLLISRNYARLKSVQSKLTNISPKVKILAADISQSKDIHKIKSYIQKKLHHRVDILVNSAAIYGPIGNLEKNRLGDWKKTFSINVFGTVSLCRLVIPLMKQRKFGRIINFSGGGDGPFPNFTAYSASKGAIVRFTESLAAELIDDNILVNAIAPGAVNTNLLSQVLRAGPHKAGQEFYQRSLKQKTDGGIPPQKTADLVLLLASAKLSRLTGKVLSSIHDDWLNYSRHSKTIATTDIYNLRRIKPKDRGYDW